VQLNADDYFDTKAYSGKTKGPPARAKPEAAANHMGEGSSKKKGLSSHRKGASGGGGGGGDE
jgi:hypothetical protein